MKLTGIRVAYVFALAMALALSSALVTYLAGQAALDADRRTAYVRAIVAATDAKCIALNEAETGQRGYMLTGDPAYLLPYRRAIARIPEEDRIVDRLVRQGSLPPGEVEELEALCRRKLDELARTVELRRQGRAAEAIAIVRGGEGEKVMESIREETERLSAWEQDQGDRMQRRTADLERLRDVVYFLSVAGTLATLAWAFRRLQASWTAREHALDEVLRQRELFATTLASIGDAVIVTDTDGRVRFMNGEAQRLCGWTQPEADGKPLPEVFRIVNEDSRQPVENPVEKVLRLGAVVGLANHTVLTSRDGTERPIDDSAAPIRQRDGGLGGVVLVFRDFTAQRPSEQELARHRDELERLVRERTARLQEMVDELRHISYAITHDMRAPLRAMSTYAEMLHERAERDAPSSELADFSGKIVASAARLDRLIVDSLHYTKAVLQSVPLEPVELSPLVRDLISSYPNLQPDKADIRIEGALPTVLGSESLLIQCFSNLLGNAVKFVAPEVRPAVRVRAQEGAGVARILVEDNGIGIPAEAQKRLYGMFQKLDDRYEGTGVGLAIVRKVVERMGGRVGAESAVGKGSVFWVELKVPQKS